MQDSAAMVTERTWGELVPDKWLAVAVVSITINACTLLRLVVSHAIARWNSRRCRSSSKLADCESGISRLSTPKKCYDYVLVSA